MVTLLFQNGGTEPDVSHRKKQLLNHIVDGMAAVRPRALYAEYPIASDNYEAGYGKATYSAVANAVNGVAWWLVKELGEGKNFETLAYVGYNDIRHNIMILAGVKAGYKMLLISPRNTVPAYINLFNILDCKTLITAEPRPAIVPTILAARPLRVLEVPSLDTLLNEPFPHFPFDKTFEEARMEPLVVLHTSGTTGLPKPIVYTHDWAASYSRQGQLKAPPGYWSVDKSYHSTRMFVMMPSFHAGNLFATLFSAIANQTTLIYPPAAALISTKMLVEGLKLTQADIGLLPPPLVEEIGKSEELLAFVEKNLPRIFYAGGDVSQPLGDAVSSRVELFNVNGSTEMGSFPILRPEGKWSVEDWRSITPHPAAGLHFRPYSENLFELVVKRNPDFEEEQPVFKIFTQLQEFETHDLYTAHPSKPGSWLHFGRTDDTIVLLSGLMVNPILMETRVSQVTNVQAVLMVGTKRRQTALLVEPVPGFGASEAEQSELVEAIWPTVQEVNRLYETDSKISKSHVLITLPGKPMLRAGKGTVQRAPTLELYAGELDQLYVRKGDVSTSTNVNLIPK